MSVYNGLDFDQIELQEVNLFVGISGSGKSKLLNSLFDVARFAIGNGLSSPSFMGTWIIEAKIAKEKYKWFCQRENDNEKQGIVVKERIEITHLESGKTSILIDRTRDDFRFKQNILPKLDASKSCIELLKDEDEIKTIHKGFTDVIRRNFSDELRTTVKYASVDKSFEDLFKNKKTLDKAIYSLFSLPLNVRLFLINRHLKKEFQRIIHAFQELFPEVQECLITDAHKEKIILSPGIYTPVFMILEKEVKKKIPLHEISAGMIKVLLILTDVLTMPDGFIYELDEYENSLGVNVINFLPTLLLEHQKSKQFLITTHHPYLINQMPVKNWYVLSRHGEKVHIKYGDELVQRYGKSSQESFMKLINDPFYSPENK